MLTTNIDKVNVFHSHDIDIQQAAVLSSRVFRVQLYYINIIFILKLLNII